MSTITFAFLREGTSDDGLIVVLRELIVLAGASAAVGESRPYRGSTEAKLNALLEEDVPLDLVFVHRDADTRDARPRYEELARAAERLGLPPPEVIGVIPVRMTETWALSDPNEIRSVAGRPSSTCDLRIPEPRNLERMADAKQVLKDALVTASETSGRRRQDFQKQFFIHRRTLLERIDAGGPVSALSSFARLKDDIEQAVQARLRQSE